MKNMVQPAVRLDQMLMQLGYAQSRERAKALIQAGHVIIDKKIITKVATRCTPDVTIEVTIKDIPWVSRAALKLEKALEIWPSNVTDTVCLDIGASTGGFTEVLLQRGAKKVYALDVGHNQLASRILNDPRVINMEGTNIRATKKAQFIEPIDIITTDVSFISLKLVLPKIAELLRSTGKAFVLIKPQFEVGRKGTQNGIVRDPALHQQVIDTILALAIEEGLAPEGVAKSPIEGMEGNKEFLLYLTKP
jgi:23S rRNA (cytidine1920-2'-O)/16S rRNA (cytidine1409-2'-O)-methyltransferase